MENNNQISNQEMNNDLAVQDLKVESTSQAPQPQAQAPQPQTQAPQPQTQAPQPRATGPSKESLWYLDNYILLRDYYDRTISRIAARCVRMGNIAIEEYPHFSYILDVLEEISETGKYVLQHKELHPYIERKIKGGVMALQKNLSEYEDELQKNSSPDMIKDDGSDLSKMKDALGGIVTDDPTKGAGMSMDDLMNKLMKQNDIDETQFDSHDSNNDVPDIKPGPKQF